MTRDEIMAMQPGRELDALVATELFELIVNTQLWITFETVDSDFKPLKSYSTDISAAWEVVTKLHESNIYVDVISFVGHYRIEASRWDGDSGCFYGDYDLAVSAVSVTEAICKAALLAVLGVTA